MQVGRPFSSGVDADALHVRREAFGDILLQVGSGIGQALGGVEPRGAAKVVLVGGNQVHDVVQGGVGGVVDGGNVGNLALEAGDGLGILQVEVGHLHVDGALSPTAGVHVVLEGEVARLQGHEGYDGGYLIGVVDAVAGHGLLDEGSGLRGSAAVVALAFALLVGHHLGEGFGADFGRLLGGRVGQGRQGHDDGSRETHGGRRFQEYII